MKSAKPEIADVRPGEWQPPPPVKLVPLWLRLACLFALIAVCALTWILKSGPAFPFLCLGLTLSSQIIDAVNLFRKRFPYATRKDEALLEGEDNEEAFLVIVHIIQNEAEVGADRGVIFFEEGAVCFVGHATSFRIGRQDAILPERYDDFVEAHRYRQWKRLWLRHPQRRVMLGFQCLKRNGCSFDRTYLRLTDKLNAFFSGPPASGVRQYPPLEPSLHLEPFGKRRTRLEEKP